MRDIGKGFLNWTVAVWSYLKTRDPQFESIYKHANNEKEAGMDHLKEIGTF